MFQRKSTRHRSKPRTVFLQERKDDAIISARAGQGQKEIYILPARRQAKGIHVNIIATPTNDKVQIAPSDEIEPRFRTPCTSLHVDAIKIETYMLNTYVGGSTISSFWLLVISVARFLN